MSRMTVMAVESLQKQASVQGAINTAKTTGNFIDSGFRWLGRALGVGKKQLAKAIDQKAKLRKLNDISLGRTYSTDAAELLRIKRLQEAGKLADASEAAVAKAERLAGYGTAGAGILGLTAGGAALVSGKGDKNTEEKRREEKIMAETLPAEAAGSAAGENESKAAQPKSNALRNSLVVGGATAAGATVGGLIDRRNRLRGMLLGGLIAGGSTGLGLALAGRNNA